MKKALLILLALTMMMSMVVIAPIGASAAEEEIAIGSVAADYKPEGTAIATADDFAAMAADGKYYLSADITVSATYMNDFTGVFDGNGHTITTSVTLFDKVDGTVKNLNVNGNVTITACDTKTTAVVARVGASTANATFENIRNNAPISADNYGLAAIVGNNGEGTGGDGSEFVLTIKNCANYGAITTNIQDNKDSGSMIGMFNGKYDHEAQLIIDGCVNYGTVNAGGRPGGIVGFVGTSANITNCANYGDIQAVFNYCGGIAGRLGNAGIATFKIENCTNYGALSQAPNTASLEILSTGEENVKKCQTGQIGGMCGYAGKNASLTFKNCVNNGKVGPSDYVRVNSNYGGIFGTAESGVASLVFQNCVNNGDVTVKLGVANEYKSKTLTAGGIAALVSGSKTVKFESCVNNGNITADGKNVASSVAYVGGISGSVKANDTNRAVFSKCANAGDVSAENVVGTAEAAGIVGYIWGNSNKKQGGADIQYCSTTGDVKGSQWVAGLIAYTNCDRINVSCCVIAGNYTNSQEIKEAVAGEDLAQRQQYKYTIGTETYYFYAANGAKIDATTNKLSYTLSGATVTKDITEMSKTPVSTYVWWNESQKVDTKNNVKLDTIFVEEGSVQAAYVCGDGTNVGTDTVLLTTTYTKFAFTSGEVAYSLNEKAGKDVFFQNLMPAIFEVDAYPTTDATHAKVIDNGQGYTNELLVEEANCTPDTGDTTIYVAAALAVSALALGGLMVAKKKKVRD